MHKGTERYTIGQLAQRTGVSARTIRFWSDRGIVPPVARSSGGYRLYDGTAVERLELAAAMRKLGLDLSTVQKALEQHVPFVEIAENHIRTLDVQIRALSLARAVLAAVVRRNTPTQEAELLVQLAGKEVVMHGLVERLALPRKWTAADLAMSLEREWGQTIVWSPLPEGFPPELCGMHFNSQRDRLVMVFHQPATDPALERSVIAHAAAHMLLDHGHKVCGSSRIIDTLLNGYESDEVVTFHNETEAAILADLLVA